MMAVVHPMQTGREGGGNERSVGGLATQLAVAWLSMPTLMDHVAALRRYMSICVSSGCAAVGGCKPAITCRGVNISQRWLRDEGGPRQGAKRSVTPAVSRSLNART